MTIDEEDDRRMKTRRHPEVQEGGTVAEEREGSKRWLAQTSKGKKQNKQQNNIFSKNTNEEENYANIIYCRNDKNQGEN